MNKRWHLVALIALAVGLGFGIWKNSASPTKAVASGQCSPSFIVNTAPTSTTASQLVGPVSVNLSMTASPVTVQRVVFMLDGTGLLGRGQQGSGNLTWSMMWLTQVTPRGVHYIQAHVLFADGTDCVTPATQVFINNPTIGQYVLTSGPQTWQGPTNVNIDFVAHAVGFIDTSNQIDITPYVIFEWSSTIGSIAPQNEIAKFASGPVAGTGTVKVVSRYGGMVKEKISNVSVVSQDSTVYPATTATAGTTGSGGTSPTTNSTSSTATIPATSGGDAELEACILAAISRERYDLFVGGKERPTPQEFEKIRPCFARRNFVLPSNFTPLPPKSVADQKVNEALKVGGITNKKIQKKDSDTETQTLVFTGAAKANSSVLLYVFSEPLVLTTTADNNGNWSYSLEDPLASGSHEVYAVVDKGDGSYERSNPFSFVIGTAQASAENPNGLSLEVTSIAATPSEKNGQTVLYVAGVAALVVILIAGLFMIVRRKSAHKKIANEVSPVEPNTEPQPDETNVPAPTVEPQDNDQQNDTLNVNKDQNNTSQISPTTNNFDNTISDESASVESPDNETMPQEDPIASKPEDQQNKS